MARVEWFDAKGEWCDLLDHDKSSWQVTYRKRGTAWEVMFPDNRHTAYIPTEDITEQQLRDKLRLEYLLTRGET